MKSIPVLGMLVLAAAGCSSPSAPPKQAIRKAPDFALADVAGKTVRLSDSAGQVRLIDFWATWCPPCREAIPHFKELHEAYGSRGLTILAISMDEDPEEVLPPFLEKWKVPYANLIGDDRVAEAFGGVFGLPTTFLVDREGNITDTFVGGTPKQVFEDRIRDLLGLSPTL
jgi:thiol-disulfide isomerase/thioredoxin